MDPFALNMRFFRNSRILTKLIPLFLYNVVNNILIMIGRVRGWGGVGRWGWYCVRLGQNVGCVTSVGNWIGSGEISGLIPDFFQSLYSVFIELSKFFNFLFMLTFQIFQLKNNGLFKTSANIDRIFPKKVITFFPWSHTRAIIWNTIILIHNTRFRFICLKYFYLFLLPINILMLLPSLSFFVFYLLVLFWQIHTLLVPKYHTVIEPLQLLSQNISTVFQLLNPPSRKL